MKVYLPGSLDELWDRCAAHPDAAFFAGGTDIFVKWRAGSRPPECALGLERIAELQLLYEEADHLFIGAAVTHATLLAAPVIREDFPVLAQALRVLGAPAVRSMGTIGGNLCTASPAGDTLPPLYVLGAQLELRAPAGVRRMPIDEWMSGPGRNALGKGELLYGVRVPKTAAGGMQHFEKVGLRKALAIAVASLAARLSLSPDGIIEDARFAWGSVGPVVVTCGEIERAVIGLRLNEKTIRAVAPAAMRAVSPIDDVRASAEYRRSLAGNLLFRLLEYRTRQAG